MASKKKALEDRLFPKAIAFYKALLQRLPAPGTSFKSSDLTAALKVRR
jgi:hypothetical protein